MKKLFLFMAGCMLALSASAGIESSILWGYYMGDASGVEGLGDGQSTATTYRAAIFVPGNGVLAGATLTGANVPFPSNTVAPRKFDVYVGTFAGDNSLLSQTVSSVKTGYNTVVFDTPIAIPATGLYVTYSFSGVGYPIGVAQAQEVPGSIYLSLSATGAMDDYVGQGLGILALQVYVEGATQPDNAASISYVEAFPALAGEKSSLTVELASNGDKGVKSIGYTLTVDGQQTKATVELEKPIVGGFNQFGSVAISANMPATVGRFEATLSIDEVNGVANETPTTATFSMNTLSRAEKRLCVIEEYTGTGCGYCPRGWVGMEAVKSQKSDKAIVLALHQYNSSDPMYISSNKYAAIPFSGAPQCTIDRTIYPDPYYGMDNEGILTDVDLMSEFLPTVAVKVEGAFTDSTLKQIDVKASTEFLTPTEGYTLAFAITADSISGTTSSFKQSNYYYSYSKGNNVLSDMPELAKFFKGGEWAKSSVALTFNDVVIASSYVNYKTEVEAFGFVETGAVEQRSYTLTMPTKSTLVKALRYDQIFVNALVIDDHGYIANAARARVPYGDPQAVENVSMDAPAAKMLINGQLQIRRGDNCYDALGRIVK